MSATTAATATLPPTAAAKTAEPERNITPAKEIEAAEQATAPELTPMATDALAAAPTAEADTPTTTATDGAAMVTEPAASSEQLSPMPTVSDGLAIHHQFELGDNEQWYSGTVTNAGKAVDWHLVKFSDGAKNQVLLSEENYGVTWLSGDAALPAPKLTAKAQKQAEQAAVKADKAAAKSTAAAAKKNAKKLAAKKGAAKKKPAAKKGAAKSTGVKKVIAKDDKPKVKRPPSAYNIFMKEQLPGWKASNPATDHKTAFAAVAALWRAHHPKPAKAEKKPKVKKVKQLPAAKKPESPSADSAPEPAAQKPPA